MSGKRQFGTVRKLPLGRWQARYRDGSGQMFSAPSTLDRCDPFPRGGGGGHGARAVHRSPRGTSDLRRVVRPLVGATR
jgi:hypothetical protein